MSDHAIGEYAVGESRAPVVAVDAPTAAFDWRATVISQYANSPILLRMIEEFADAIDPARLSDDFYSLMWNVDTAVGYGLDVWGRIVGVGRVLQLPDATKYLGWAQSSDGQPFDQGVFYKGGTVTGNYALTDTAYRRLIYAKALANICDGSVPAINRVLMSLFDAYGNCYVEDGLDMTMRYRFATRLSVVDFAIVAQSGVLPRSTGVAVTIVQP